MNNLHRELAPISDAAWAQIEEETTRTLKRYLAGRRVVDVPSPGGIALPGVGTGHLKPISAPAEGIIARQREVKPLVELRVPFELSRQAIDDVERGSDDSDWQPAKDAAKKLAFAEDRAIFNGYHEADIQGIREGTSNPIETLPADVRDYPDAVAHALSQLRLVGVNGPYSVLLGADEYTALAETRDHGYPVLEHVKRIVDGNLIWAPAIEGAFVADDARRRFRAQHRTGCFDRLSQPHRFRGATVSSGDVRFPRAHQRSRRCVVAVTEVFVRSASTQVGGSRKIADGPVSRILRLGSDAPSEQTTYGKQRTYTVSGVNCVTRARITGTRWTHGAPAPIVARAAVALFAGTEDTVNAT